MVIENNTTGLQSIVTLINGLPEFHEPHLQNKTVTPSASQQTVVADIGYDGLNSVTVEGSSGNTDIEDALITRNISTYENDRVISVGRYAFAYCDSLTTVSFPKCITVGNSAFLSCSSLTTANFPECTSIGYSAFAYCSSLTTASFPKCITVGNNAFTQCDSLTSVSFPKCITISSYVFSYCNSLTTANFPECTTISGNAFAYCDSLTTVSFPKCITVGNNAFLSCSSLTTANFPECTNIGNAAFYKCYNLTSFYLTGSSLCTLSNSTAFISTPIGGYSKSAGCYGSIYVPQSLLASYQTATNWTYFSSRFVAYDAGTDGGNSGEIITFTINGTEYEAEEGMTWAEWCDSEYNTGGIYINTYNQVTTTGNETVFMDDNSNVDIQQANDVIVAYEYYLAWEL